MKSVFIVGSKGIPAQYGGFETFVDELVSRRKDKNIKYYVACMGEGDNYEYNGAKCFRVKVPNIGAAKAVFYDLNAIKWVEKYARDNDIHDGVLYILACRIGPFFNRHVKRLHKLGFQVYVNPDGHEWMRAKWNWFIKKYWKLSEKLMVKHADLMICDSKNIEKYIRNEYKKYTPNTVFIPYGADTTKSKLKNDDKILMDWYKEHDISPKNYYLVVGRFVPENNYETILREFMKSNTKKDLVIISDVKDNKFYRNLLLRTSFKMDARIKFVGTVYDRDLVKKIREEAFAYVHGHSVGGTNPSLLEALASTDLNILYDCGFNREVAEDGAMYFSKKQKSLACILAKAEALNNEDIAFFMSNARKRIIAEYYWDDVVKKYEDIFR